MKRITLFLLTFAATLSICLADDTKAKEKSSDRAVAVFQTTSSAVNTPDSTLNGTVYFTQVGDSVKISGTISGLQPGSVHGFHIHQYGDLTNKDGTSAGGHFNPSGHQHSSPEAKNHHAGDLGNITADKNGRVKVEQTVKKLQIENGPNSILGRSLVIHAKADDLKSQPSGDAGPRVGVAIIGWANTDKKGDK